MTRPIPRSHSGLIALLCFALALVILVAMLAGCDIPEADTPLATKTEAGPGPIEVTRVGVFKDVLAYGDKRGIYLIRDTRTGKEYIGISGIGISEVGSHSDGKNEWPDER